ncbi:MAG: hypothetical protein DK306_002317 [Chloroflexi bacterium]|nr:MAG: hypothetical protein DK306_002317 [Chloroflexota bacterium]
MQLDERHAGEEGVIRSDIAEMVDRAAAMAAYAFHAVRSASGDSPSPLPDGLPEKLAEQTYVDVLRYSLDECACACHQDHPAQD